jgi:hypothetical protein
MAVILKGDMRAAHTVRVDESRPSRPTGGWGASQSRYPGAKISHQRPSLWR